MRKSHLVQLKKFLFLHNTSSKSMGSIKKAKMDSPKGMHFFILKTIIAQGC
ncbi:hypothetical protein SRABI27_04924 [Pedobacter sp. Bi27]|nr:hypothetical protein SRABI36_04815 [Pedobacter sp. Bi36]CAH0314240.1 hypothetical protein SRABI27_04924 [Pedobacter sp. Bi27]CAH0314824.1 hypothetical protein SRABI126_04940 [Pedobacter sp. Bi126]